MKKIINFNKKTIIYSLYFAVLLLIPTTKIFAVDFLTNISFTGPSNNTVTTSDEITFTFKAQAPKITTAPVAPNLNYNVYFTPYCDGVVSEINKKYIYNASKVSAQTENISKSWSLKSVCPVSAKNFRWKLEEVDSNSKVLKSYADSSFTFKINENYRGWYFIAKSEASSYYYYRVSDRYTSEVLCNTGMDTFLNQDKTYTVSSKCASYESLPTTPNNEDKPVAVAGSINEMENKSIYRFLAPIGKITCMDTTGQDPNCISNNIGTYLNFIFKLGIGVCAALAVIMLIISGISYMGDESVFGKTEAKGKMFSAILGLLIAIGAWALLNTINPDLTGSKGLSIAQANIEIENESTPWIKYEKNDGKPVVGCSEGFTDVTSGNGNPIHVCKSIATDLAKLITAAKKDGITLSGGGFRSKSEQLALRAKNCQPPTRTQQELESGSISCRVATAIPGNSNHEKGLAIDFTCNGSSMGKNDTNNVCYKWLVSNASKYGLYNKYATLQETWHWSVSGT